MRCNECGKCEECIYYKGYPVYLLVGRYLTNIREYENYCNISTISRSALRCPFFWQRIFMTFKLPIHDDRDFFNPLNLDVWLNKLNLTYNALIKTKNILKTCNNYNLINIIPDNPHIIFILIKNIMKGNLTIITMDDVVRYPKIFELNAINVRPVAVKLENSQFKEMEYLIQIRFNSTFYKYGWIFNESEMIYFLSYIMYFNLGEAIKYLQIAGQINNNGVLMMRNANKLVYL